MIGEILTSDKISDKLGKERDSAVEARTAKERRLEQNTKTYHLGESTYTYRGP